MYLFCCKMYSIEYINESIQQNENNTKSNWDIIKYCISLSIYLFVQHAHVTFCFVFAQCHFAYLRIYVTISCSFSIVVVTATNLKKTTHTNTHWSSSIARGRFQTIIDANRVAIDDTRQDKYYCKTTNYFVVKLMLV